MAVDIPAYQLRYSARRRSLQLQIKGGQLLVAAPMGLSLAQIEAFIRQKQNWIIKHLNKETLVVPNWLALGELPYLGRTLKLRVVQDQVNAATLEADTLWLQLSARNKAGNQLRWLQQLIQQFYCRETKLWFGQQAPGYAAAMAVDYQQIQSGDYKRKWGSCTGQGVLSFNWRLMMAPEWVCHYLLVHELAHLRHMNHSALFWQLVEQHNADAKNARHWLRQHQHWMSLSALAWTD